MIETVESPLAADPGRPSRLAEAAEDFGEADDAPPGAAFGLALPFRRTDRQPIRHGLDISGRAAVSVASTARGDEAMAVIRDNGRPFDPPAEASDGDAMRRVQDGPAGGPRVLLVRGSTDGVRHGRRDGFDVVARRPKPDRAQTR